MISLPVEDRDFPEWHGGCRHALVWVVELDRPEVRALVEAAQLRMPDVLLRRYRRQPHLTLAYAGLAPEPGLATPPATYGAGELAKQLAALQAAGVAPFQLTVEGFHTFRGGPWLAAAGDGVLALHDALGDPSVAAEGYRPHVTIGLYTVELPLAEIEARFDGWTGSVEVLVESVSLMRYETNDIAGPLQRVGVFQLASRRWLPSR